MAETITIGSEEFDNPNQGTSPKWGEQINAILSALSEQLNSVSGIADLPETSATLLNTSGVKNITSLAYNPTVIRSSVTSYNISRKITKAISTIPVGTGTILITCAHNHDLYTDDQITIASSNSTPSIDGTYTITKNSDTTFTITIGTPVTVAGNTGEFEVELVESGELWLNYGQQGFQLEVNRIGNAKMTIDFTSGGQATYDPTVLAGSSYIGLVKFIGKALLSA